MKVLLEKQASAAQNTGLLCFVFLPVDVLVEKNQLLLKMCLYSISSVNGGRTVYTTTKTGGKRGKILRKRC